MHVLMNRSIECFIRDTYGATAWRDIAAAAGLEFDRFEALMTYDDALIYKVIDAAAAQLSKPGEELLEDLGPYLVSHPNLEGIRRLLRFGGENFVEFLYSLDDLPDRARLAVSDLTLPVLDLRDHSPGTLTLRCAGDYPGFGYVMVGVLRAMADDYGDLAVLEHLGRNGDEEMISIQLMETSFTQGRAFDLSAGAGCNDHCQIRPVP